MPAQQAPQPNEQEGPRRVPHAFGVPGRSLEPMGLAVSMCSSGALVWASAHLSVLWNLAISPPPIFDPELLELLSFHVRMRWGSCRKRRPRPTGPSTISCQAHPGAV